MPSGRTVQLAVRFDDAPGIWTYHCQILDHGDGSLTGMVVLSY